MPFRVRNLVATLAAILASVLPIRPSTAFDLEAYRTHLRETRDLTAQELIDAHQPFGPYLDRVPAQPGETEYLDGISSFLQLTTGELELLRRHDFMVSERLACPSFGQAIRDIWHADMPLFVSSDAILHALHRSYVDILGFVETEFLRQWLGEALNAMHAEWPTLEARYGLEPAMQPSLVDVDVYLTVARSLLAGTTLPCHSGHDAVVREILDLVAAGQPASLPLFNDVPRIYDFSQLKPRGHYTQSVDLERYFRAMMWLGRTEIRFTAADGAIQQPTDLQREIIDAFLLRELARVTTGGAAIGRINELIQALVGEQDNMTLTELDRLATTLQIARVDQLLDSQALQELLDELETGDYSGQEINSQILLVDPMNPDAMVPARAFLLIGQRFILDSFVAGNVVFDRIQYQGRKIFRGLPSPLDVLYTLGNDDVLPLLAKELERYHYAANLSALRYLIDGYDERYCRQSLYTVWLQAIRSLAKSGRNPNVPAFMRTGAWQQQKMNTQLASWAELRHDNLLYAKQSYTGGGVCSYPRTYVEPLPQLYHTLAVFAEDARVAFAPVQSAGPMGSRIDTFFARMQSIMQSLVRISEKELTGDPFAQGELEFLSGALHEDGVCTLVESGWYRELFFSDMDAPSSKEDLLVADVHTQPTLEDGTIVGRVLHVGTGHPQMGVFIATPPGQPRTAFVGPVSAFAEHVTTDFLRLTDQEWKDLYESGPPASPAWTHVYLADSRGELRDTGTRITPRDEDPDPRVQEPPTIPRITLAPNHPNPFNPSTRLSFRMDVVGQAPVRLTIYDARGRLVHTLLQEPLPSGTYHTFWDGTDHSGNPMPSGTYLASLQVGPMQTSHKMVLLR